MASPLKVVSKIADVRHIRRSLQPSSRVGLVPTMGYLHAGHASLVAQAKKECDFVFTTIFVNPTQFGPKEDLSRYPRNLEGDLALLQKEGCDAVFTPNADEIYLPNHKSWVDVDGMDHTAEGLKRPGHFRGVATVVTKLFNIFQPTRAYFGQKDAIQSILIRKMVKDLNFPLDVVISPTVRDPDGLAMSSRNSYLNQRERANAPVLYKALKAGESTYMKLRRPRRSEIVDACMQVLQTHPTQVEVDYISLASMETGEEIKDDLLPVQEGVLLAGVIKMGTTRLLDNVILPPKSG